jgi:hypothetical protein
MIERRGLNGVVVKINHYLVGGVSAGMPRVGGEPEPEDEWGLKDLEPTTADWYGDRESDTVSFEDESEKTLAIQEGLDEQVVMENIYHEPTHTKGLPPCKRVKQDF